MAAPILWFGNAAKLLKSILDINGNSQILSGTVDPSSSATSAPVGSLYLNNSNGNLYIKQDAGSSTNWNLVVDFPAVANSIALRAHAGYGATNNKVPYYTNTDVDTGSAMTLDNSSTLGASITINEAGIYSCGVWLNSAVSGAVSLGITLNGNQLTTDIYSVTGSQRISFNQITTPTSTDSTAFCSVTRSFAVNDVIRPQSNGATPNSAANAGFFITQVQKL